MRGRNKREAIFRRRHSAKLYVRYFVFFMIIELVTLIAFGFVQTYYIYDLYRDDRLAALSRLTEQTAAVYSSYLGADSESAASAGEDLMLAMSGQGLTGKVQLFISDPTGKILYCSDMARKGQPFTGICVCSEHGDTRVPGEIYTGVLAAGKLATVGDFAGTLDQSCFITASTVSSGKYRSVGIVFIIQDRSGAMWPYVLAFLEFYVPLSLGILLLMFLITYVYTRFMTKPLKKMSDATKQYAQGNLSHRIEYKEPIFSVREFEVLTALINNMAEKLEQSDRSRASFVANISHELKTPMTTIGGFVDGMLDGTIPPERRDDYLRIVSSEVHRLTRLVYSMLDMSKLEAGEIKLTPSRINLTEMILQIFISFEQKLTEKNIDVIGLDQLRTAYVDADRDLINQVFYNLTDNAVKFTDHGGRIIVMLTPGTETTVFRIRNTGKVIDSEDIDHVFERFYKGDKSRSANSASAGLGLFIVKSIVELHQGDIQVENIDDEFTQFSVTLRNKLL